MKKPLLIFIILALLIIVTGVAYKKYCERKPENCKNEKFEEREDLGPEEGIDW
jgi:Tfp pilus assembly protein PilO